MTSLDSAAADVLNAALGDSAQARASYESFRTQFTVVEGHQGSIRRRDSGQLARRCGAHRSTGAQATQWTWAIFAVCFVFGFTYAWRIAQSLGACMERIAAQVTLSQEDGVEVVFCARAPRSPAARCIPPMRA